MVADCLPLTEIHQGTTGVRIATMEDTYPFILSSMRSQATENEMAFVIIGYRQNGVDSDEDEVVINAYRLSDIIIACPPTRNDVPT